MPNGCTARACLLTAAGSLRLSESLALKAAQRIRKRRIPFDFQRTSLAGLALDSATSSGAPRSAMQDPIQAPPGTTRQAGLYTS
ncbi:hypothetical protein TNCV_2766171 [Trichonephila clavipes]|nr:hypothetical protein TNCV_2766171 [Trichonephila clavipes]